MEGIFQIVTKKSAKTGADYQLIVLHFANPVSGEDYPVQMFVPRDKADVISMLVALGSNKPNTK